MLAGAAGRIAGRISRWAFAIAAAPTDGVTAAPTASVVLCLEHAANLRVDVAAVHQPSRQALVRAEVLVDALAVGRQLAKDPHALGGELQHRLRLRLVLGNYTLPLFLRLCRRCRRRLLHALGQRVELLLARPPQPPPVHSRIFPAARHVAFGLLDQPVRNHRAHAVIDDHLRRPQRRCIATANWVCQGSGRPKA